jgi:hypothetical protein
MVRYNAQINLPCPGFDIRSLPRFSVEAPLLYAALAAAMHKQEKRPLWYLTKALAIKI